MAAGAVASASRNEISLKGSVAIVSEFFGWVDWRGGGGVRGLSARTHATSGVGGRRFSINSILYQRGVYPPEGFEVKQKYGLPLLVTTDEGLKSYLSEVLTQLQGASAWWAPALTDEEARPPPPASRSVARKGRGATPRGCNNWRRDERGARAVGV